jgi:hypothetical protein
VSPIQLHINVSREKSTSGPCVFMAPTEDTHLALCSRFQKAGATGSDLTWCVLLLDAWSPTNTRESGQEQPLNERDPRYPSSPTCPPLPVLKLDPWLVESRTAPQGLVRRSTRSVCGVLASRVVSVPGAPVFPPSSSGCTSACTFGTNLTRRDNKEKAAPPGATSSSVSKRSCYPPPWGQPGD